MEAFRDNQVEQARRQGGVIPLGGGRRLLLPRVFGFCGGVVRALFELERCVREARGQRVFLLGPVIHNDSVNSYFRSLGVDIVPEDGIEGILGMAGPDDRIVIPAFGVPLEMEQALRERFAPSQIVDTTCRDVRAVWGFLAGLTGADWTVVIHGKPDHPETRATLSRARRHAARVVVMPSSDGTAALCRAIRERNWACCPPAWLCAGATASPDSGPVALVNQTTMLHDETVALAAALRQACHDAGRRCAVADTVCRATQNRQDAARELCRQRPEPVLVVGGFASSNTSQLYRMARECTAAYMIQSAAALAPDRLRHWLPGVGQQCTADWLPPSWTTVGILAGASCPATDIGAVIRWFQAQEPASSEHAALAASEAEQPMRKTGRAGTGRQERKDGGSDET